MSIHIVLGSSFGDEGKGKVTNFLSKKKGSLVVRFNGGHQAGHTVVQNGVRHVFSSFGSGTLNGSPTFVSKYCTIFPPAVNMEYAELLSKGVNPLLYVDPLAMVVTPYDIALNRYDEKSRTNAHGSCGSGFGKTVERHETLEHSYRIFAKDLSNEWVLRSKLDMLEQIIPEKHKEVDMDTFVKRCLECSSVIRLIPEHEILVGSSFKNFVFEGAQGILLDREHGIFPHVTRSHTTSLNVNKMLNNYLISAGEIKVHYLCRAYQTRHGNGPLLGEEHEVKLVNNEKETNVTNEWQGVFRKAPLSLGLLKYALDSDISYHHRKINRELIISHLDQLEEIPLLNGDGTVFKTNRDTLVDLSTSLLGIPVITHNSESL
jgi:adenylosuccinate synthase